MILLKVTWSRFKVNYHWLACALNPLSLVPGFHLMNLGCAHW